MKEISDIELCQVAGGVSDDAAYGASVGVSGALLGLGLTVTAPVWGTAALIGGSIAASGMAIYYAMR